MPRFVLHFRLTFALLWLSHLSVQTLAFAYKGSDYLIPAGAGVSSPALSSGVFDNPAVFSEKTDFQLNAGYYSSSLQFLKSGVAAGMLASSSKFGFSGSVLSIPSLGSSSTYFLLGSSYAFKNSFHLGVGMLYSMETGAGVNLGLLYSVNSATEFGFVVYGLKDLGAGLTFYLSRRVRLVLDFGLESFSVIAYKPGLLVTAGILQLGCSVGGSVQNAATNTAFSPGPAYSMGILSRNGSSLTFSYNHQGVVILNSAITIK
ncbi:hypothetical protein WDW37_05540 [Bdellovibrionota bacterium FG-1]